MSIGNEHASGRSSSQRNLEPADSHSFSLRCQCGWTGELFGGMATRHWVELGDYIDLQGMPDCSLALKEAA